MDIPTIIKHKSLTFIISGTLNEYLTDLYICFFKKHNVKHIVRVSNPTYDGTEYQTQGFILHDLFFPDGSVPNHTIINNWELIVNDAKITNTVILVHCICGLGRAPVMVALSLIKEGMNTNKAIEYIRNHRHGCFNCRQLKFLQTYKSSKRSCLLM